MRRLKVTHSQRTNLREGGREAASYAQSLSVVSLRLHTQLALNLQGLVFTLQAITFLQRRTSSFLSDEHTSVLCFVADFDHVYIHSKTRCPRRFSPEVSPFVQTSGLRTGLLSSRALALWFFPLIEIGPCV